MRRPIARLWGPSGTHVEYNDGLNYCIRQIRVALGDDPVARLYRHAPAARLSLRCAGQRGPGAQAGAKAIGGRVERRRRAGASLMVIVESRPNNHHEIAVGLLRAVHDLVFSAR